MPDDERGPGKKMYPHNQDAEELAVLERDTKIAEELVAIRAELSELQDAPAAETPLRNGLLPIEIIPPLNQSHLPDLSGEYQPLTERDMPDGYPGLDKNGKLSPYTLSLIHI